MKISCRNVPRRNSTGFKILRVFFSAPRAEGGAGTLRSGPRVGSLHGRVATCCARVGCRRNELRPSRKVDHLMYLCCLLGGGTVAQERDPPGTLGLSPHARVLLWRISRRNVPRRNATGFRFFHVFFSAPRAEGGAGTLRSGPRVGALRGRVATCCDRVGYGRNELRSSRKVDHSAYLCYPSLVCLFGWGTDAQERVPPGTLGLSPYARVLL